MYVIIKALSSGLEMKFYLRFFFLLIVFYGCLLRATAGCLETDGGRCELGFDLSEQTQHLTEVTQIELMVTGFKLFDPFAR